MKNQQKKTSQKSKASSAGTKKKAGNSSGITGHIATPKDFNAIEPLLKINCKRMKLTASKCAMAAKRIIEEPDFGLFVVAKKGTKIVGYVFFTYEWSDWRDGVMYWLQGL